MELWDTRVHKEIWGVGRNICYLDCCDRFTNVYLHQNSSYFQYVRFILAMYTSKKICKKTTTQKTGTTNK